MMMSFLLNTHSGIRWLIVIIGVLAILRFLFGWLRGVKFTGMDRGLSSGFSGLMDLQVLIGVIFLFWTGTTGAGFPAVRIEHTVTMLISAIVAHLPLRWRDAADTLRFRNTLLAIVASLVIVYLGVARLPGGWSR
jgi:hypothetical protein